MKAKQFNSIFLTIHFLDEFENGTVFLILRNKLKCCGINFDCDFIIQVKKMWMLRLHQLSSAALEAADLLSSDAGRDT